MAKTNVQGNETKAVKTTPRLKTRFDTELKPQLLKDLSLSNVHEVPRLVKIVVSVGLGRAKDDKRLFEAATNTLAKITGQYPVQTLSRKSIAGFKLREGQPIGIKVTLRGDRMYEFIDRLINVILPRLRDFHGVPKQSFDAQANFNIGLVDQSVFPELSFEETAQSHGVQVTIVTSTTDRDRAQALLSVLGMPFERQEKE